MDRKVILILADGMRPDAMAHLPYVRKIMAKSAYTMQAETIFPSVTLPCHMSLFLGVPAERHGVTTNLYTPPVRPVSGLCEQLNLAKKSCAVFYDWEELRDLWRPGSVAYARLEREQTKEVSDRSTDATLAYIAEKSPDFVFLYLGWPDAAGHGVGWMTPTYMQSVVDVWEDIRRVIEQCGEEYTIFITADHGGHDRAHGTTMPEDMLIPLICLGPDFTPGEIARANIMDIAPTVVKLMGATPAPEWEGRSLI